MSKIIPVNSKLLIEVQDKLKPKSENTDPFAVFASSKNLGIVRYSSEDEYPAGQQLYFGSDYETIVINGTEMFAMDKDNVIARLLE